MATVLPCRPLLLPAKREPRFVDRGCAWAAAAGPQVKQPTEQEVLRARHLTYQQVTRLEEVWRSNPGASGEGAPGGWEPACGAQRAAAWLGSALVGQQQQQQQPPVAPFLPHRIDAGVRT